MDNQELTDVIEAYLDNALPEDRRRDVEQRMETDKAFRQEVRLHRHLRGHLSDPNRWKHYAVLAEAGKEPVPPDDKSPPSLPTLKNKQNWKWTGLLVVFAIFGVAVWQWWKPAPPSQLPVEELTPKPAPTVPLQPVPQESKPEQKVPAEKTLRKPLPKQSKPQVTTPIAQADFDINDNLERKISGMRSVGMTITPDIPKDSTDFPLGKADTTYVIFKGIVEGAPKNLTPTLKLYIFNNKDSRTAIETSVIITKRDVTGTLNFDHSQALKSKRGLYYYIVRNEKGEFLHGGKFTIGRG